MRNKKGIWILVLVLSMALVLTGCGGTNDNAEENGEPAAEPTTYERIMESGVMVAGLDDNFPPMGYRNESQELVGFDIDFGEELAKRMDVELKWQPTEWDGVILSLYANKFDFILSGMSVTPERMEQINFTTPYVNAGLVMVVPEGVTGFETAADLEGKIAGTQMGSTGETATNEIEGLKEVKLYKQYPEAFQDLEIGRTDVLIVDAVTAQHFVGLRPDAFDIVGEQLNEEPMAIGIRQEDEDLLEAINTVIAEMQADGTLTEISMKWFGFDITQ